MLDPLAVLNAVMAGVLEQRVEGKRGEGRVSQRKDDLGNGTRCVRRDFAPFATKRWADESEEEERNKEHCGRQLIC